ncbi:hypothetical protein CPB84DRAFT_563270 [Gymnopilus junonius]|uniref:Uncharacterized protein n=1 Tax=Gymnopilus junonius TaxID=109634 RepID=A0A9P5NT15_GYMJU|nr:hypothetical protein CPB84DRAFT_563270 [Gymnopilus junonius]
MKPKEEAGWLGFYRKYQRSATVKDQKESEAKRRKDDMDRMSDIKDFLVELQNPIRVDNPKTWKDVYPTLETQTPALLAKNPSIPAPRRTTTDKQERNYTYALISTSGHHNVPKHTVAAYDELYEACFAGDDDKIQRLCLPAEGQVAFAASGATGPLNISVRLTPKPTNRYGRAGATPLFAAIAGRQWTTAKLILAIATAQYHPDDERDRIKFDTDVDMYDDSDDSNNSDDSDDDESIHSDDSGATVEQQEVKLLISLNVRQCSIRHSS